MSKRNCYETIGPDTRFSGTDTLSERHGIVKPEFLLSDEHEVVSRSAVFTE